MRIRRLFAATIAVLLVAGGGLTANAEVQSPWQGLHETKTRLVSTTAAVGDAEFLTLGLEIAMAPGWKTYWRSPGDAGMPPQLDWQGSQNLADAKVLWPAPKRFTFYDLDTFGYTDRVIFPLKVRLEKPGGALAARLKIFYQVCKDICIPVDADLALELPAGPAATTVHSERIRNYEAKVPIASGGGTINIVSTKLDTTGDRPMIEVIAEAETPFLEPDLIIEGPELVYFGRPKVRFEQNRHKAVIQVPLAETTKPSQIIGQELVLTLIDGATACETKVIANADG